MDKPTLNFIVWHLAVVPKEFLKAWFNYLIFVFHFIPVGLLLRTLFVPWKRQSLEKKSVGFNPSEWFTRLTFNAISRLIGAFIRLWFITFAVILELAVFLFGLSAFVVVILTPILSLPTFLFQLKKTNFKKLVLQAGIDPLKFTLNFLRTKRGQFLFYRLGVSPDKITKVLKKHVSGSENLSSSLNEAKSVSGLFLLLTEKWSPLLNSLEELGLKTEDIKSVLDWFDKDEEKRVRALRFWERENLLRNRGLGTDWSFGYTINLDQYSIEYTQEQSFASHLVGRDEVVSRMETILSRETQSSILLIGEEGVGKRTTIYQLADHVRQGKVYPALKNKRVLEVNVNKVLTDGKNSIELQNKFEDILQEATQAGNIILVIPNIDRFVTSGEDRVDLSPVLNRALGGGKVKVIGISTPDSYQKYLYPNTTINGLFEKVEVFPPDDAGAKEILQTFVSNFEKNKKILITYQAIVEAVEKSGKYITDIPFPEKAIDLLDEAVAMVQTRGGGIIGVKEVDEVLSVKAKVPIGDITKEEKDKLLNLEQIIHRRLVNQEEAVSDLANSLRRARTQVVKSNKPIGVFLFLGPTGVGKTETAKALAEAYFGNEERLVRLDMNEFQDEGASIRLLGDFQRREPGILIKLLRESPFCVLLLDELEKASDQVLNLFLSAFDEGYVSDNFGKKVSLKEMIIICTSNAGAEFIRQKVSAGEETTEFKKEFLDYLLKEREFSPEFLNRFDSVVLYKPLNDKHLRQIARLMLEDLNRRLEGKKVGVKITEKLLEQMAKQGNDPVFGARPMRRLMQDKIEAPLAKKILEGSLTKGEMEIDI